MEERKVKLVSSRKLDANRRNALKSTGPRTPEGKQKSRWNALRHGVYATDVVIPGEDAGAHQRRLSEARRTLEPTDTLEDMMVENLVANHWLLQRVRRAEGMAIEDARARLCRQRRGRRWTRAKALLDQRDWERVMKTSEGLTLLIRMLRGAECMVGREQTRLAPPVWQRLVSYVSVIRPDQRERMLEIGADVAEPEEVEWEEVGEGEEDDDVEEVEVEDEPDAPDPPGAAGASRLRRWVAEEVKRLRPMRTTLREREQGDDEREAARVVGLPPSAALKRILRYEAARSREFYQAAHELGSARRTQAGDGGP